MKIREWLQGKKTYVCAAMIGITAAANALGYEVPEWVYGLLAMATGISLKAGIERGK